MSRRDVSGAEVSLLLNAIAQRQVRIDAIYIEDQNCPIRKSHENPEVKTLYDEFLHEPLGP